MAQQQSESFSEIEIFIAGAALIVTMANVCLGIYLTTKYRMTKIIDKIHELSLKRMEIKQNIQNNRINKNYAIDNNSETRKKKCENKSNHLYSKLSDIQLQIKHLLLEALNIKYIKLTQSQYRLLADCCEEYFYYSTAESLWLKVFSKKFLIPEMESEYHRRYAQFLYEIHKEEKAIMQFEYALTLSNSNDGCALINMKTCEAWLVCIYKKIKKDRGKNIHVDKVSPFYYYDFAKYVHELGLNSLRYIKNQETRNNCYSELEDIFNRIMHIKNL